MEDIVGIDYIIMSSIFILTFLSPLFCLILVFFARTIFSSYQSIPVASVIFLAFSTMGINVRQEFLQDSDIMASGFTIWIPRMLSVVFLIMLPISSYAITSFKYINLPLWNRFFLYFALVLCIPMGFVPFGIWIDGYHGFGSSIGYQSEFMFRMFNLLTFNFLSHFDRGGFSTIVTHASDKSISAYVFDVLVSTFVISTIFAILLKRKYSEVPKNIAETV